MQPEMYLNILSQIKSAAAAMPQQQQFRGINRKYTKPQILALPQIYMLYIY